MKVAVASPGDRAAALTEHAASQLTAAGRRMQRPRALVMAIPHEHHVVHGDTEMLDNALKFGFRDLPVGVDDELTLDSIEHDPSPWPFFVFGVTEDADDVLRRASGSPAFPDVVMAVWAREELPVFLGFGQRASVRHQEDSSGIIPHEPVGTYVVVLLRTTGFLFEHLCHRMLMRTFIHDSTLRTRCGRNWQVTLGSLHRS
jgi:hypothetical protein